MPTSDKYLYIRAIRDGDSLRWEYQVHGSLNAGRMAHDEDLDETWSDDDVRKLTIDMFAVDVDQHDLIEIKYE